MNSLNGECYHCGLPLPTFADFRVAIGGATREMCCRGCQAVAQAIVDHGLSDYYRHRSAKPGKAASPVPDSLEHVALYDVPEVQRTFVREAGEHEKEASLLLEGITCAACVWLNEQHIARLPGVCFVHVNYVTHRARVRWDERQIRLSDVLREIASIGYSAHPYDAARLEAVYRREQKSALWRLFVAGFAMMQVMMYAVPVYLADGEMPADIEGLMRWASLVLTLPVIVFSAQPFFAAALQQLNNRTPGMDVPVSLGIAASFVASVWSMATGEGEVYFDSVTMFVFLLLAARYLESVARHRAAKAAEELVKLVPARARRMHPETRNCEEIPASALTSGDFIVVWPGETIPADGTIIEGESSVSEALLTGESAPVRKALGDAVIGGSQNTSSPIVIKVTKVGEDSVLSAIVRLLDRALTEKPRLAQLADRIASRFVIALLVLAAGVAAAWMLIEPNRALAVTVAVLVVTCPCALSLATPAALAAATGSLARRGVLVTRGHALETLARATHFVFDKTGTLTSGTLNLVGIIATSETPRERCLDVAAALQSQSEHSIAHSVRVAARSASTAASDVISTPGAGIEATVEGKRVRMGTFAFVGELVARPLPRAASYIADDVTVAALGDESGWLAFFTFDDALKADARVLVRELQSLGKKVSLLSGDRAEVVCETARKLGIDTWRAGATPEVKLNYVRELAQSGAVVAMAGDGVNDAPVMAGAHVSIAIGGAAEVSQAAADVILLSPALAPMLEAIKLARKTLAVIRQNLVWSLVYNAVALPFAVAGYVSPWLAGLGMAVSSLAVVVNALRVLPARRTATIFPISLSGTPKAA